MCAGLIHLLMTTSVSQIAISCSITPISLTLFRKWIEPINADGSPMQMSDGMAHKKELSSAPTATSEKSSVPGRVADEETI